MVSDGFGWFRVVSDGFGWFAVLVVTIQYTVFVKQNWTYYVIIKYEIESSSAKAIVIMYNIFAWKIEKLLNTF